MGHFFALALGLAMPTAFAQKDAAGEFQNVQVRPGDTLRSIAQAYLKDPTKWGEVLQYNMLPSVDPTAALPEMTLRVPIKLIREELQAAHLVYRVNRSVFRRKDGVEWLPTTDNMELFRNDAVKTFGDSKAIVRFTDDELMQVDPDSMAIIMPTAKDYHVELKRGGVVAGNRKILMGSAMVSPTSSNTVYTAAMRSDKSALVQVYRGQAAVKSAGKTVKVAAGKATEVKQGLAPSLPFEIRDFGGLKSWVAGFESQMASLRKRLGKPSLPARTPAKPLPVGQPEAAASLAQDASSIGVLQAVMGYRIQCSRTKDLQSLMTDRFFEADARISPESFKLPRDEYWCRIAAVDLLGNQGAFKGPRLYTLGSSE
ncbi:MAG: LysM peptidoglycan-binding domain-containing protein [Elusimicrobia bacterium]|nr:LysM peptidoglycan-binding domain-containing protein [Elusimicrobiota bacterium]